jgi:hypothetical protein
VWGWGLSGKLDKLFEGQDLALGRALGLETRERSVKELAMASWSPSLAPYRYSTHL